MASSSASASFERYDTEFHEIIQQIEVSIEQNKSEQYINHLIQQCTDLLKQMSVEARSNTTNNESMKQELLNKVRTMKSQLTILQSKVSTQSLFRNTNNNTNSSNNKYEQIIQQNENALQNQNDILERTKRSILETEQIAYEITDELTQNRQTLINSQNRIQSIHSMTNNAKQILSNMNQRNIQQKMILYGIMIAFILAFFFMVYNLWS